MVEELIEPAHVLIVQISSVIALIAALVALFFMSQSRKRFTPGVIKKISGQILTQIAILSLALIAMAIYHIFDLDIFQDIWHVGAIAALAMASYLSINLAKILKKLS